LPAAGAPQFEQRRPAPTRCFPLPPQSSTKPQPDPAREVSQHHRRFAEAEVAAPAPHIRNQLLQRRCYADALCSSRDLSDSLLKPMQGLWRDGAPDLWTSGEAKPEKLSLLRSRDCALCRIHLEFELLCDESRDALHHPLTRPLAANVDVTIVRVAHEAMSPALEPLVEFIKHEVAEQRRKWTPCGVPSTLGLTSPFSITPAFKNARMSFSSRLSATRLAI
jgi:hypothetical protein